MQPCKTGDQPYSDTSPNGECSLAQREGQITIKPLNAAFLHRNLIIKQPKMDRFFIKTNVSRLS